MSDVWVLGCGPSLSDVAIPPQAFTIGTNNSYLKHWSPVYASCDPTAIRRDWKRANALSWWSALPERKLLFAPQGFFNCPEAAECYPICRSGTFAYWVAAKVFRASKIYLLGFDMEWRPGHFIGTEGSSDYEATREVLRQQYAGHDIPTRIWRNGWVPLEAVLDWKK